MSGARRTSRVERKRARSARGFTLIETMLAVVILGLGVVVILRSMMTFLQTNTWSTHSATAGYLGQEIRELTRNLPRHDAFSGGLYIIDEGTPTLYGWGLESGEILPEDIDDIDDLDGLAFGAPPAPDGFTVTRWMAPGAINAFGEVLEQALYDGSVSMIADEDGELSAEAMRGWSQFVRVEKLDPYDLATVVPNGTYVAGVRPVNAYPLRVTVTVTYDGVWADQAPARTEFSWIVPP
jgi:prepilin-type N-terminal cleavage/methylation domain-containing protein